MAQEGLVVRRADYAEIEPLRAHYRAQARCQIVRDSILPRRLADAYVILQDQNAVGYCGVWNKHFPDRLMEFAVVPKAEPRAATLFHALVAGSGATHVEAQTNMPKMLAVLDACAEDVTVENLLFEDGPTTELRLPGAVFRERKAGDEGPEGEWVVEMGGSVVAAGGALDHYNPPFRDLYMEVLESARGRGVGSYLVQELRRVCREAGGVPAARCDPENEASKRTLERGGLTLCGELRAGRIGARDPT